MDNKEHVLSLIGLCLRGRNLEVGEEPVEAVSRARDARVILLASDAADNTLRRVKRFAEAGQCVWLRVPFTKGELGQATGRSSAAVAAITDIGLAVAVVRRLAELDHEKYDEDLAKLELKAKRAQERRSEAAQHEKNLRRGVKRPKKQTEAPDRAASSAAAAQSRQGKAEPGRKDTRRTTSDSAAAREDRAKGGPFGKTGRKEGARPSKSNRPKSRAKTDPYAHSRPVKKGKGSFRKKEG